MTFLNFGKGWAPLMKYPSGLPATVTTSLREPSTTEDVFGKSTTPARPVEDEDQFDAERVFGRIKDADLGE